MVTATVEVGDKFVWNDALNVEVIRTYKRNRSCIIKVSSLLTSWEKKQELPFPETFVPVESFPVEFDPNATTPIGIIPMEVVNGTDSTGQAPDNGSSAS